MWVAVSPVGYGYNAYIISTIVDVECYAEEQLEAIMPI